MNVKRRTYRNFLIIRNKLMRDKHYPATEAGEITRHIFDNAESDPWHSVEWFYNMVVDKIEWEKMYANR